MAEIITDETIEYVESLAKLKLKEEERIHIKTDMQNMLNYIGKLNELDTSVTQPMSHVFSTENVFREDVVTSTPEREAMLANAPKQKEGQYQVPKTVE